MGDAVNRQSQRLQLAHLIHGGIDRDSPQSTWNSPTPVLTHTELQQKRNSETQVTNETKTTHLPNSATTRSAWCCPSEHYPQPPLHLDRYPGLHPSGEHVRRGTSRCTEDGPRRQYIHTKQREHGQKAVMSHPSWITAPTNSLRYLKRTKEILTHEVNFQRGETGS
jgi:hypothetical protein